MPSRRIAVLGAGPVGLECALAFVERGDEVRVYERDRVGGNVRRWGHVRLFSPFQMNHSERGAARLREAGVELPSAESYLFGEEHVARYLEPLARTPSLAGRVHERTKVVSVGRDGIGKSDLRDLNGGPRDRHAFRILLESDDGTERVESAEVVIDCTGTYGNANGLGNGNLPARGERRLATRIGYELLDVMGSGRGRFEGKRVLLVGGGHSAATALDGLLSLRGTTIHWVARRSEPLDVIENDPLPERRRLSEQANRLAAEGDPQLHFHPGVTVESLEEAGDGFRVTLREASRGESLIVDEILAHVGYQPDNSIYRELQVHQCYASEAPMKLAAALLESSSSADCLAESSKGPETLRNPEPNFYILGAKSYGRGSNFLIRIGLAQIEELLTLDDDRARQSQERAS
jgi:thioredoxin reductase